MVPILTVAMKTFKKKLGFSSCHEIVFTNVLFEQIHVGNFASDIIPVSRVLVEKNTLLNLDTLVYFDKYI